MTSYFLGVGGGSPQVLLTSSGRGVACDVRGVGGGGGVKNKVFNDVICECSLISTRVRTVLLRCWVFIEGGAEHQQRDAGHEHELLSVP